MICEKIVLGIESYREATQHHPIPARYERVFEIFRRAEIRSMPIQKRGRLIYYDIELRDGGLLLSGPQPPQALLVSPICLLKNSYFKGDLAPGRFLRFAGLKGGRHPLPHLLHPLNPLGRSNQIYAMLRVLSVARIRTYRP